MNILQVIMYMETVVFLQMTEYLSTKAMALAMFIERFCDASINLHNDSNKALLCNIMRLNTTCTETQ